MNERTLAMALHNNHHTWVAMSRDDVETVLDNVKEFREETGDDPVETDFTVIYNGYPVEITFNDILVEVEGDREELDKRLYEARN